MTGSSIWSCAGDALHFFHNPALRLEEVHTEGIDYPTWYSSYLYTQHAYRFQTLYRIVPLNPSAIAAPAPSEPLTR